MSKHQTGKRNQTSTCEWEKEVAAAAAEGAAEVVGEVPLEDLEVGKRLHEYGKALLLG